MPTVSDDNKDGAEAKGHVLSEAEAFQTGGVLSITFAHATNDTYTSFLAPLLPALIAKLALSKTEAGLLEFLRSTPSLLQPVIGHLGDRVSLRYFVILAPAVTATLMSSLGVAPRYAILALLLMAAGLSSASLHAVAPAMAGRLSGRKLGLGMGLWMVGGTLGYAVGPFLVVSTVNFLTLEGTPWLMIGGWLASVVLYVRLKNVSRLPATDGQTRAWREGWQAIKPILPPVVGIIMVRALMIAAVITFLPTFLTEEGANLWVAGVSLSLVHLAGIGGSVLAGSMSDWCGRRLVVFIFMLATPLLIFLFLGVSGWARIPALLALGVTVPTVQVVLMALVQENCPENRALANGIFLSVSFISESAAAIPVGALGDLFGLRLAFAVSAVVLLLGSPLARLLPAKK